MAENPNTVVSPDGALQVTLVVFDAASGECTIRIEELSAEKARYSVIVRHSDGCETRIDYATYDVNKHAEHSFFTNCNDAPKNIEVVRVFTEHSPQ
jgi:hypothetical protein